MSHDRHSEGMRSRVDAFAGIEPSLDVLNNLLAAMRNIVPALSERIPGIRWLSPLQMHLTLRFLPDVEAVILEAVADAVRSAIHGLQPFELEIRGLFLGPRPLSATALWAGVADPSGGLGRLVGLLDRSLEDLGFVPPDPTGEHLPHLAVAAFPHIELPAPVRAAIDTLAGESFGFVRVTGVELYVCEPIGATSPFRIARRVPFARQDEVAPERFARPRRERARHSGEDTRKEE